MNQTPKDNHYKPLTSTEKQCNITLNQDEQMAVLQAYDYGIESLNEDYRRRIDAIISKLKDQIHP